MFPRNPKNGPGTQIKGRDPVSIPSVLPPQPSLSPYLWRQCPNLELTIWARLPHTEPQGSPCFLIPHAGLMSACYHTWLLGECRDPNSVLILGSKPLLMTHLSHLSCDSWSSAGIDYRHALLHLAYTVLAIKPRTSHSPGKNSADWAIPQHLLPPLNKGICHGQGVAMYSIYLKTAVYKLPVLSVLLQKVLDLR